LRRKFAKRWRREALRRGVELTNERYSLNKHEAEMYRSPRGFCVDAKYNGWTICCIGRDELEAYRMLVQEIDYDGPGAWFGDD
jgi:hypothetical protein